MNSELLNEVRELPKNRLENCPLAKLVGKKAYDISMSKYDRPLGVITEVEKNCPIEGNNGHWEGERGDSVWTPAPDYIPKKGNPEGKIWGKILDKYGKDGIEYEAGEPAFDKISKDDVKLSLFHVTVQITLIKQILKWLNSGKVHQKKWLSGEKIINILGTNAEI